MFNMIYGFVVILFMRDLIMFEWIEVLIIILVVGNMLK